MKAKNILKSRRWRSAIIGLSAILMFTLFFHINANAHISHHEQDMHSAHHSSSACVTNFCCFQLTQNNFALEPYFSPFKIFNLPLSPCLNRDIELPYKPPKS